MQNAVKDSQRNKAVLGLPAMRIRHFGTHTAHSPSCARSIRGAPTGLSMMERMEAKFQTMQRGLPSRSPTPCYPWAPPILSDEFQVSNAKTPLANHRSDEIFADKVLKLL